MAKNKGSTSGTYVGNGMGVRKGSTQNGGTESVKIITPKGK